MTRTALAELVNATVLDFRRLLNDNNTLGACLFACVAGVAILKQHGLKPRLLAGTLQWPRIKRSEDDGVCATHFSYVFENSDVTRERFMAGNLPELHCWLEVDGEIVDFATGDFPKQCNLVLGLPWTSEPPPPFLWAKEPPPFVIYEAHPIATKIAHHFANRLINELMQALPQKVSA